MNNILTFEDYKKMNIRQVESVIYRQFMEDNIKSDVNEGFIRNAINKASGKFIQNALADEIENENNNTFLSRIIAEKAREIHDLAFDVLL